MIICWEIFFGTPSAHSNVLVPKICALSSNVEILNTNTCPASDLVERVRLIMASGPILTRTCSINLVTGSVRLKCILRLGIISLFAFRVSRRSSFVAEFLSTFLELKGVRLLLIKLLL